jgi:hypothetical protein
MKYKHVDGRMHRKNLSNLARPFELAAVRCSAAGVPLHLDPAHPVDGATLLGSSCTELLLALNNAVSPAEDS